MQIQQNISLKQYNTFGIDAMARFFSAFSSTGQLAELADSFPALSKLILGGGSNILFTKNVEGLVLKNEIMGIQKIKEDENFVYVQAGAGENWHQFVQTCIANNWCGVENLSLIPGHVGATPMQNIGAYGVEIKEVFYELEAFHLQDKKPYTFTLQDCEFGYRESVFKKRYKGQFVILQVTYKLSRQPRLNTGYGAIEQELERMKVQQPTIRDVSQAVINIRSSKLPDPQKIGNAGSFFKNPSVSKEHFQLLHASFPDIVGYQNADRSVKLAAGWLIEQCGWKGFRRGDAGCHARQALVLVNYGSASGQEIYRLSEEIVQSVKAKFGVALEREVNIV
ncbi:MAG TPA: UDP-N-acetylmuramate dehydrogenase [Chitinophagaceae bacterium]|nr:UDP-N-acetylmuramate dehydrogenase [Chitinophagaceae bacterium]